MIVKLFCPFAFCRQYIYFPALIRCSASLGSIISPTFKKFLLFTPSYCYTSIQSSNSPFDSRRTANWWKWNGRPDGKVFKCGILISLCARASDCTVRLWTVSCSTILHQLHCTIIWCTSVQHPVGCACTCQTLWSDQDSVAHLIIIIISLGERGMGRFSQNSAANSALKIPTPPPNPHLIINPYLADHPLSTFPLKEFCVILKQPCPFFEGWSAICTIGWLRSSFFTAVQHALLL